MEHGGGGGGVGLPDTLDVHGIHMCSDFYGIKTVHEHQQYVN